MKCSNAGCGLPGQGNFCQTCGSNMVPDTPAGTFIICGGKLNGQPCGAVIVSSQNFCTKCGAEVDQSLFNVLLEVCKRCNTVLGPDCMFCARCGLQKGEATVIKINDVSAEKDGKQNYQNGSCSSAHATSAVDGQQQHSSNKDSSSSTNFDQIKQTEVLKQDEKVELNIAQNTSKCVEDPNVHSEHSYIDDRASEKQLVVGGDTDCRSAVLETKPEGLGTATEALHKQENITDITYIAVKGSPCGENVNLAHLESRANVDDTTANCQALTTDSMNEKREAVPKELNAKTTEQAEIGVKEFQETASIMSVDTDMIYSDQNHRSKVPDSSVCGIKETKDENANFTQDDELNIDAEGSTNDLKGQGHEKELQSMTEDHKELQYCSDEEPESIDPSVEGSEYGERNMENIQPNKKHLSSGESKSKRTKKRNRKKKSHREKFNMNSDQTENTSSELNKFNEGIDGAEATVAEEKAANSIKLNELHTDNSKTNSSEEQKFVFGNKDIREQRPQTKEAHEQKCSTNIDRQVALPQELPQPSFFSNSKHESVNDVSKDADLETIPEPVKESLAGGSPTENNDTPVVSNEAKSGADKRNSEGSKQLKENKNEQVKDKQKPQEQQRKHQIDNDGKITVVFHVLVSTDMLENEDDQVLLKIGLDEFGGWVCNDHILTPIRKHSKYWDMEIKLRIDRFILRRMTYYKYGVKRHGKGKFIWENYHDANKRLGCYDNRRMYVEEHLLQKKDIWHQFDGMVTAKPSDNFVKRSIAYVRGKYEKDSKKNALLFAKTYCPPWFKPSMNVLDTAETIQESVEAFECLMYGLGRVYVVDSKCWYQKDDFKKEIVGGILSPLTDSISSTTSDCNFKIVRALAVVVLCNRLEIQLEEKIWQRICRCLLISPNAEKNNYVELDTVLQYFNSKGYLQKAITQFVKTGSRFGKNPSWLFCMPLLHFLTDMCKPFDVLKRDLTHNDIKPKWWGIVDVESAQKAFKNANSKWTMPLTEVVSILQPLFEMDPYLPRTLAAALSLEEFLVVVRQDVLSVDICCAVLFCYVKQSNPSYTGFRYPYNPTSGDEMLVINCLAALLDRLQEYFEVQGSSIDIWWTAYKIATETANEALNTNRTYKVVPSVQIFLHCISVYERVYTQLNGTDSLQKHREEYMQDVKYLRFQILSWLQKYCSEFGLVTTSMEECIKIWDLAFVEELQSKDIRDSWNKEVSSSLISLLGKQLRTTSGMTRVFVQHYCEKIDTYSKMMQGCLNELVFMAIEEGYDLDIGTLRDSEKKRFGRLLSEMFMKEWNKIKEDQGEKIFMMFLTWSPFLHFVKSFYKDDTSSQILTDECKENLSLAATVIESHADCLINGNIQVGILTYICENADCFSKIVMRIKGLDKKGFIERAVRIRQKEVQTFEKQASSLRAFVQLCHHASSVDTSGVDDVLQNQADYQIFRKQYVSDFCSPVEIIEDDTNETTDVDIFVFNISNEVKEVLQELSEYTDSYVFSKFWGDRCSDVGATCKTMDDVVRHIWAPVKQSFKKYASKISSGDIVFQEVERVFSRWLKDDEKRIVTEMKLLGISESVARIRVKQMKQHCQLESCVNGAKVILLFAKQYQLKGTFAPIKDIASFHNKTFRMDSFDESLMETCAFLEEVTADRSACLHMFVKCDPLIHWVQESMDRFKELSVFVDLAFMSVGDDQMSIDLVQFLHSAVTGYAPLIFDLKQNADYADLLKLCRRVWNELDNNAQLPAMLYEINRHLDWLKDIQKAHGSVEVTSFAQASAINEDGIYTVGRNAWILDGTMNTGDRFSMETKDVLRLTVREKSEKDSKRLQKDYTLSQLQDLTSRLMLVAGKAEQGNDSVDRFIMIFDGVTRLCNVYIELCAAGCVLFQDWSVRCLCDVNKPVALILEFGHGDGMATVKGRRSESEDLKDMIPELAKFMERCLEDWLLHICQKRKKYVHLNYFTVDQLVILQRELVKVGTEDIPSHLIYPLLSAVNENCTPADLIEALTKAKEEIHRKTESETEQIEEQKIEVEYAENCDEKKQNFIRELMNSGYEESLAVRALDHVEPDDVAQGIVWCMDHEFSYQTGKDDMTLKEENIDTPAFSGWSQSDTSLQLMITSSISKLTEQSDVGSNPLMKELSDLWEQFLVSVTLSAQDYLSLEHLGLILKYLAMKNSLSVSRSMHPTLLEGQPNLIVCPSDEVLVTTLGLYMRNKDQPLPQSDEVIMCTANTTKDEVDIFWRRAIFDSNEKIHCLVNADLLNYDVSESAYRCLEEYLQELHCNKDSRFQLVVICGSDNEYRSPMISSLDKHLRQPPATNVPQLRTYIADKLSLDWQATPGLVSAASVDGEGSTVRLIKSWRAGVGKTLFTQRKHVELRTRFKDKSAAVSIPLHEKIIDMHYVIQRFLEHTTQPGQLGVKLFHIDISHEVENGIDYLLFNLLILGSLVDKTGFVFRKSPTDIYLIETMPLMTRAAKKQGMDFQYLHPMLNILPDLTCRSPQESLYMYTGTGLRDYKRSDQLFDDATFRSPVFQRAFQYLLRHEEDRDFSDIHPYNPEGNKETCLRLLLRYCGVQDPSWSELHHFVWFLNTQLEAFEECGFVSSAAAKDLPGFQKFVLRFLILMSRDFSTRSLNMSEESPSTGRAHIDEDIDERGDNREDLHLYQLRRTWESSPHPYLFFNSDRSTFTFLGFYIERGTGNLIDLQTRETLEEGIISPKLYDSLVKNRVPLQEDFDSLPRTEKIIKLCKVMGIEMEHDPDDTYELTTDNVKKMLAIYMRFRCDIPVIIMGETGCGKTRLIKYMCSLQMPPGLQVTNLVLMKVHGGTTTRDIIRKVQEAEDIAKDNRKNYGDHMYTVLFFDEANTTEAIGLIKEIMCDRTIEGRKLKLCENLKMVAACNPYRKHSEELIKKLEQAGLGYHVDADETTDRLGRVPMRRLVYRVQPLPRSLLPLVWDFGQLNTQVEDLYIRQMVKRYIREELLPNIPRLTKVVSAILTASQYYMRQQRDECSFVSLRDVDRVLSVMSWFYMQSQGNRTLYNCIDTKLDERRETLKSNDEEENADEVVEVHGEDAAFALRNESVDDLTRSLILALGVCYHACLKTREKYRQYIARYFKSPCQLFNGSEQIKAEIESCQDVFLDHVILEGNIARNMALKENLFMMVVCIELRIPLFLVGKPGSSKSLAKTIVSDAMQGNAAKAALFRELKRAQMVSFQCSPLSTPEGIVGTFKQCAQFQKDKDLDTFVSIVVLDEVGLAEDSPRMPLKTLHPLLEDGCQGDEKTAKHKKVAFIGISNWALDPAKMNRGILVQREVPDLEELKNSASGICKNKEELGSLIKPLIEPMAKSYLEIFDKATKQKREFFGLRDFYSLMKMVFGFVEKFERKPTWHEMLHAIKRNFGGLDKVEPVESFQKNLAAIMFDREPRADDPNCSAAGLINACLFDTNNMNRESRYLLLLTENYGALTIIEQQIFSRSSDIRPITIFGSSFRSDQEYTQVCRNINKIKICMETGNTVVLLNLENLYESLYDALNQYYVYLGRQRYVDLGLGTHRVKCPVHEKFRLIVIAEKQTVYKQFPIPLINRLEKHFLTINTMLTTEQHNLVKMLDNWSKQFNIQRDLPYAQSGNTGLETRVEDVFIGYHEDTSSAVILYVCEKNKHIMGDVDFTAKVLEEAKFVLLWCATPDSVTRLKYSTLSMDETAKLKDWYFNKQAHDNFIQYLQESATREDSNRQLFAQVTTHSKLMTNTHKTQMSIVSGIALDRILLIETLSSFDTEQQFSNRIRYHLQQSSKDQSLMVIQCDSGDINVNLIACARYSVMDELEKMRDELCAPVHVIFIVQLPRHTTFPGFQCGMWHSVHIDDLLPEEMGIPAFQDMIGKSVASLFTAATRESLDSELNGAAPENRGAKAVTMDTEDMDTSEAPELYIDNIVREQELQVVSENVDTQLNEIGSNQDVIRTSRSKLNIKALILSSVQSSLSNVKDKVENSNRETDRLTLLLKLLHSDEEGGNKMSFLHGICCLIGKILEEIEEESMAVRAQDWLIYEAADLESISKTGTFRRSCVQVLESKVAPIFAGIIAYLDTNWNLNLLDGRHTTWRHKLWLTLLNTCEALNIQSADLKVRNMNEFEVMTTGYEGHIFCARMPFSWLLINQINELLQQEDTQHHSAGDVVSRAVVISRVLGERPFNVILSSVVQEEEVDEVVDDYLHDFIHCVYHAGSEEEQELVYQIVNYAAKQLIEGDYKTSMLISLINIHLAHETLVRRLTYFREMNSVCQECSASILQLKRTNPDHYMFKEQEFTFSAVCMLIEKLAPKKHELDQSQSRLNWLNKVHKYRPVIEKVISLSRESHSSEHQTLPAIHRAKCLWSRIVVVKLFLEHVCTTGGKDKISVKYCMPLWTTLGEETDLKIVESFGRVERFLKSCNKAAMKEYIGIEKNCSNCERLLEGPPIILPCEDVLCSECAEDVKALGRYECTKCHIPVPIGFKYERQKVVGQADEKLKDYQKRCNAFFMDVVSQLCFAENTAPSQQIVEHLLSYIFLTTRAQNQRTRDWTVFDTGIDPNPVFRSFLLRILIRTSKDSVIENIERYLTPAKTLISRNQEDQDGHIVELCLLIIQCLEDMFNEKASAENENEIDLAIHSLQRAIRTIGSPGLNAGKLYGLASARIGLAVAAQYIANIVMNMVDPRTVPAQVRKVIEAAQILCEDTNIEWTRIYLIKCLCRSYGIDVYRSVCRSQVPFLRWIALRNMNIEKIVEVTDRYIVSGKPYAKIREAVTKVALGEYVEHLKETLQELRTVGVRVEPMFILAVHREVTSSYLYPEQQRKLTTEAREAIGHYVDSCEKLTNKPLLKSLLQNQLTLRHLTNEEGENMRLQGIQCLVVHFQSVITYLKGDKTLLHPLCILTTNPQSCIDCFLPTMPQDDLEDVKEALLDARHQGGGADPNPVFYRCPNGHPYVIGNCGRPATTAECKECGAAIGGTRHVLSTGNTKDHGRDSTMKGHILGRVDARGQGPKPERSMTPAYNASVRLLLHIAMYTGAGSSQQGVQMLIKPDIEQNHVEDFLWSHIQQDVDDIRRALNLSVDDVMLFIHIVIDRILRTHNEGEHVRNEVWQLSSKRGRQEWESNFCKRFIQDILQNLDVMLKTNNQLLANDQRLGADPLLCLMYETDTQVDKENPEEIENVPRVWRYRTFVSLQHLRQEAEAKLHDMQGHKVLQLFIEEEHHLRALRYIPSILRLHRVLLDRYQKKIDKADAADITLNTLVKEQCAGLETKTLLEHFKVAWEMVRNSLKVYLCPTEEGGKRIPKECCNTSIDENTPLAILLPSTTEMGLCSYAMLDFLFRKQNDFLDKYLKETRRESSSITKISPRDVTAAHLISYDPKHDILPLVLSNCQYSFEMGKGTKIEYDFTGLERQLMDRFLFSKSMIDIKRVLRIDMMTYRTEITNATVFRKLSEKIPQVELNSTDKAQICSDIRYLPDLCQSLENLNIAIGFLKSTGGEPEHNLHYYMVQTLQMKSFVFSPKAQHVCLFQHAKSLWLLLSHQKAKKMTDSGHHSKAVFESVPVDFHCDLSEELLKDFANYLRKLTVDILSQLLEVLFEFIVLVVAARRSIDDDDDINANDKKLGEWLYGYVDSMDYPSFDAAILADFPGDLLYKHSTKTWIVAYSRLKMMRNDLHKI